MRTSDIRALAAALYEDGDPFAFIEAAGYLSACAEEIERLRLELDNLRIKTGYVFQCPYCEAWSPGPWFDDVVIEDAEGIHIEGPSHRCRECGQDVGETDQWHWLLDE